MYALRGVQTPRFFRYRTDFNGNPLPTWARLDPISMSRQVSTDSHRRLTATIVAAAARPTGRLGGFPTGRPWDFASDKLSHLRRNDPAPLSTVSSRSRVLS
jgi:hypothetical protein